MKDRLPIRLMTYSCMYGHVLHSENDLQCMLCPVCLGRVKDKTANDPMMLSFVQEKMYEIDDE